MHKTSPHEYPNLFGGLRNDHFDIRIYSEGGKAKNMNTDNMCRRFYYIQTCVSYQKVKQVKRDQKFSQIVQSGEGWSEYSKRVKLA